ncbi:MAG: oligosaccharide flippase family protein [Patescibacteria group bacterium]
MFTNLFHLIKNNKLVQNSAVFFTGTLVASFGSYLFHLLLARFLGVAGYGEMQSLLSILTIFGIPLGVVSAVIIKYTANYKGAGELGQVRSLLEYFTKKMLFFAVIFYLVILAASGYLTGFLNLSSPTPIYILGLGVIVSFLLTPSRSVLQGVQKFKDLSFNNIIEVFSKIIFALLLVGLGLKINGAIGGIVLGALVAYGFLFWPMKFLWREPKTALPLPTGEMFRFSGPVFLTLLSLTLMYTVDVILVKHFMSPELAGQYGGLAILGRIIFFLSGAIVAVMFTMSAEVHAQSPAASEKVLHQSLFLVSGCSLLMAAVYFICPGLVINIMLGSKFLAISGYLGWFGLAMVAFTLINLLAQYFLSIHRPKAASFLLLGVILQVGLLWRYHETIGQVVGVMNIVMTLVLFLFLLYYSAIRKSFRA